MHIFHIRIIIYTQKNLTRAKHSYKLNAMFKHGVKYGLQFNFIPELEQYFTEP